MLLKVWTGPVNINNIIHDGDSWENGFCNIVELEKDITEHLALGYLTRKDVVKIARWERRKG